MSAAAATSQPASQPKPAQRANLLDEQHKLCQTPSRLDKLIGVHCTHGVNRSGYVICNFMISALSMSPDEALKKFAEARGHAIERANYIHDLQSLGTRRNSYSSEHHREREPSRESAINRMSRPNEDRKRFFNQFESNWNAANARSSNYGPRRYEDRRNVDRLQRDRLPRGVGYSHSDTHRHREKRVYSSPSISQANDVPRDRFISRGTYFHRKHSERFNSLSSDRHRSGNSYNKRHVWRRSDTNDTTASNH